MKQPIHSTRVAGAVGVVRANRFRYASTIARGSTMRQFSVQGVVRNGQVVLEVPLDLPDGTLVSITDYDPEDVATVGPDPDDPKAREEALQYYREMVRNRGNRLGGSDEQTKIAG